MDEADPYWNKKKLSSLTRNADGTAKDKIMIGGHGRIDLAKSAKAGERIVHDKSLSCGKQEGNLVSGGLANVISVTEDQLGTSVQDEKETLTKERGEVQITVKAKTGRSAKDDEKAPTGEFGETPIKAKLNYTCSVCFKSLRCRSSLLLHERTHTGDRPFACAMCERRFSQRVNLRVHERSHTGERPYQCMQCDKRFIQSSELRRHLRVHTGERPFACQQCARTFGTQTNMRLHMKVHATAFACEQCERRFKSAKQLVRHEAMHDAERPFPCERCNVRFLSVQNLLRHHRIQHERPVIKHDGSPRRHEVRNEDESPAETVEEDEGVVKHEGAEVTKDYIAPYLDLPSQETSSSSDPNEV